MKEGPNGVVAMWSQKQEEFKKFSISKETKDTGVYLPHVAYEYVFLLCP